jgi:hypothetical protein
MKSPWSKFIQIEPEYLIAVLINHLESEDSLVLLSDHGLFIGIIGPTAVNSKVLIAQEVVWYASKDGRKFLEVFEEWAKERGATFTALSQLITDREHVLRALYKKYGYDPIEASYIKGLN